MRPKDAIMVNDMMLCEYLRDNESIEDEVKSKKFIREGFDNIKLNRHIRPKYKPYVEENGEVRTLGQEEINKANYNEVMKDAILTRNWRKALVAVLMTGKKGFMDLKYVQGVIEKFAGEHNLECNLTQMRHAVRSALGWIGNSEFAEHITILRKDDPRNPNLFALVSVKEEARSMDLHKAIQTAEVNSRTFIEKRYKKKSGKAATGKPKRIVEPITVDIPENIVKGPVKNQPAPSDNDKLLETVLTQLKNLSGDSGSLFSFAGDLVINININNS